MTSSPRGGGMTTMATKLQSILGTSVVESARATLSRGLDRLHGIRTEGNVALEALGLAHPERMLYVPSSWKASRVLARELALTPADTVVDFGSGKGRGGPDAGAPARPAPGGRRRDRARPDRGGP